jgi:hypothetical protein
MEFGGCAHNPGTHTDDRAYRKSNSTEYCTLGWDYARKMAGNTRVEPDNPLLHET